MNPKPGDIVHIVFLDHCLSEGTMPDLMTVETFGRVVAIDDTSLLIGWWLEPNGTIDSNSELLRVIRSTIQSMRRLK